MVCTGTQQNGRFLVGTSEDSSSRKAVVMNEMNSRKLEVWSQQAFIDNYPLHHPYPCSENIAPVVAPERLEAFIKCADATIGYCQRNPWLKPRAIEAKKFVL